MYDRHFDLVHQNFRCGRDVIVLREILLKLLQNGSFPDGGITDNDDFGAESRR